jgi:hypothetical protein
VDARHVVRVLLGPAGVVGRDQQLVMGDEPRRGVDKRAVHHEQARTVEVRLQPAPDELLEAGSRDGYAEEEEPEEDGQFVRVAEPAEVGGQLGRAREQVILGPEPALDSLGLVARGAQPASELGGRLQALGARRVGPPGRRDGADWLRVRG